MAVLAAAPLLAAYGELIATADGNTLFVEAKTGITGTHWYRVTLEAGRPVVRQAVAGLQDINADGSVVASLNVKERSCAWGGSTCFLSSLCRATLTIESERDKLLERSQTGLFEMSRKADMAMLVPTCTPRFEKPIESGLYSLPDLRLVVPYSEFLVRDLIRRPSGRRLINNRGQFVTPDLRPRIIDATGSRNIPVIGYEYPLLDAEGKWLVLASHGQFRWLDLATMRVEDTITIALPYGGYVAISDDAATVAMLSPDRRVAILSRATRTSRLLDSGPVQRYVLSGNGRYIFALTDAETIIRIDIATGRAETWLNPLPQIKTISVPFSVEQCPYVCYGPRPSKFMLGPASLAVVEAELYGETGWRVTAGGITVPLQPLTKNSYWFQVPSDALQGPNQQLVFSHPVHPIQLSTPAEVVERAVTCFGALHQNWDRRVSEADPGRAGEVVHIFLTGLRGAEAVPDGVPSHGALDRCGLGAPSQHRSLRAALLRAGTGAHRHAADRSPLAPAHAISGAGLLAHGAPAPNRLHVTSHGPVGW